jgi:hypothetical protein
MLAAVPITNQYPSIQQPQGQHCLEVVFTWDGGNIVLCRTQANMFFFTFFKRYMEEK